MKIVQFDENDKRLTKKLCNFIYAHYKDNPVWLGTPKSEMIGSIFTGNKGILRDGHPFQDHADVAYFLALDEKEKTIGCIAAVVNHSYNQYHKEQVGFFGFFEVIEEYKVAKILLDHAKNWLKERGMKTMRGPANFSTNESLGLLIENFKDVPYVSTPYNYEYYQGFIEKYGMKKEMDLLGQLLPVNLQEEKETKRQQRMRNVAEKMKKRYGIKTETFNKKKPEKHFKDIREIYNEAWKDNWGYVPLTDDEFKHYFHTLGMICDSKLINIAYVDNKPAALVGSIPDTNEIFHKHKKSPEIFNIIRIFWWLFRKKFTRTRLILVGIKVEYRRMGLDAILFQEAFTAAQERGYQSCELAWLLETNTLIIHAGERVNAKLYKRWRVYDLEL